MTRNARLDGTIVAAFLCLGAMLGSSYVRAERLAHERPDVAGFNQRVFGAAMMSACGRGLTTPSDAVRSSETARDQDRAVVDFLAGRREAIACSEIAADVPVDGLDGLQRASRYLILLVTATWRVTGPTWAGIDALLGVMYGLSLALAYAICRVGMGRAAASLATGLLLISPLHLEHLPDLRDYSKAPFFLASLLIVAWAAARPRQPVVVLALAGSAGALIGFGFGVRTDIIVNLLMVLGGLSLFLAGRLADTWKTRLAAPLVCLAAFATVASPLLDSQETRSSPWHLALLGFSHEWDDALDISPAPYELGYFYSDSYVGTLVDAYWGRTTDSADQVSVGLPRYAEASRGYYFALLTTFPADMALRAWAAVIKIVQLPYNGSRAIRPGLVPGWLDRVMATVQRALASSAGFGIPLSAIAVLGVSVYSVRLAVLLFGLVVFLGAYPAIQFQWRHYFHLEVIGLWFLGFGSSWIGTAVLRLSGRARPASVAEPVPASAWRPAAFIVCVLALVAVPLVSLRAWQRSSATTLFQAYHDARVVPVDLKPTPLGDGLVRVGGLSATSSRSARSIHSEMLVAEISPEGCGEDRPAVTFRYTVADRSVDFSRTYDVDLRPGETTRVFFPVYETGGASPVPRLLSFGGLDVAESQLPCLTRLGRFADPDRFPLLVPVVLTERWRDQPLRQTLRGWEADPRLGATLPVSYWSTPSLKARRAAVVARMEAARPLAPAVDYVSGIARVSADGRVTVDGRADDTGSYLVAWKAATLDASSVVVIDGALTQGGCTIGLADDTGWVARVDIAAAGPFRVFVVAPRAGRYQLVLANYLRAGALRNRLTISRLAVVQGVE